MKRRRYPTIRQLAPEAYIMAEAERKFGARAGDWEALNESDLTMLRNHLAARAAHIRWPGGRPARSSEADAEEDASRMVALEEGHSAVQEEVSAEVGDPDWGVS